MVEEYVERIITFINDILAIEYRGKTIKEWLLLILQYSFVLWFAILGWIGYNFYNNYKILQQQETRKQTTLKTKNWEIRKTKQRIAEIKEAYKILRGYFKPEQVAILKKALQKEYLTQLNKTQNWQSFASENYIIPGGLNLPLKDELPIYKIKFQDINLPDKTIKIFSNFYETLLNSNIKIYGLVDLDKLNNYYVLYFTPGRGKDILLKTYKYYGYIRDIFKTNIPILGSVFDISQIRLQGYSKTFLVGWNLDLTEGGF